MLSLAIWKSKIIKNKYFLLLLFIFRTDSQMQLASRNQAGCSGTWAGLPNQNEVNLILSLPGPVSTFKSEGNCSSPGLSGLPGLPGLPFHLSHHTALINQWRRAGEPQETSQAIVPLTSAVTIALFNNLLSCFSEYHSKYLLQTQ